MNEPVQKARSQSFAYDPLNYTVPSKATSGLSLQRNEEQKLFEAASFGTPVLNFKGFHWKKERRVAQMHSITLYDESGEELKCVDIVKDRRDEIRFDIADKVHFRTLLDEIGSLTGLENPEWCSSFGPNYERTVNSKRFAELLTPGFLTRARHVACQRYGEEARSFLVTLLSPFEEPEERYEEFSFSTVHDQAGKLEGLENQFRDSIAHHDHNLSVYQPNTALLLPDEHIMQRVSTLGNSFYIKVPKGSQGMELIHVSRDTITDRWLLSTKDVSASITLMDLVENEDIYAPRFGVSKTGNEFKRDLFFKKLKLRMFQLSDKLHASRNNGYIGVSPVDDGKELVARSRSYSLRTDTAGMAKICEKLSKRSFFEAAIPAMELSKGPIEARLIIRVGNVRGHFARGYKESIEKCLEQSLLQFDLVGNGNEAKKIASEGMTDLFAAGEKLFTVTQEPKYSGYRFHDSYSRNVISLDALPVFKDGRICWYGLEANDGMKYRIGARQLQRVSPAMYNACKDLPRILV